ncbi:GNAT family N-acetyltransferase [Chitinimonas arctica]|uniref:GNAT family N-acetyltransferase n=1 Tax=Chitinimonas arctica TaxID=2594795 RepID=A0A516SK39_9NEIS|nr:GNAT family N-acetyltransferase [Chitinimonas arctica]QDQ28514.1 GNAT family N-acetyltransferase [Chitinimonas arctica]
MANISPISANSLPPPLLAVAALASPGQLASLLALADYDPRLLAALPADLGRQVDGWSVELLADWREALRQTWAKLPTGEEHAHLALRLADLAWLIEDWGLLRLALQLAMAEFDEMPDWLYGMAVAEAACGRLAQAMDCLLRARQLQADHAGVAALYAQLLPRHAAQAALAVQPRAVHTGWLRLETLHPDHSAAFLWQFRDPAISAMADMPAMAEIAEVENWIKDVEAGQRDFAVLHSEHGLVGVFSYNHDQAGHAFVSFWVGCDHQGRGYAGAALAMLLEQARAEGIVALYTSIYPNNIRSRRTLERAGFLPLARPRLRGADDQLLFYASPAHGAGWPELRALCRVLGQPLRPIKPYREMACP